MPDPGNNDAALVREALEDARDYCARLADDDVFARLRVEELDEARAALDRLAATAERAGEVERKRDEMLTAADGMARAPYGEFQSWVERAEEAEAALLAAQQERDEALVIRDYDGSDIGMLVHEQRRRAERAEATITQLRETAALIAEYEPGTKGATLEYIRERARAALAFDTGTCLDCDGVGAQSGSHTERIEPCPTCAGTGRKKVEATG